MQVFEDLASKLDAAWLRQARDELAFPNLAQSALENFASREAVDPDDLFTWLVAADRVPKQSDPRSAFGNFALTVAERDEFHIDALFWTESTTAVHQHSFSGAFHVLQGSSLQTIWSFEETKRWSDRLKAGTLTVRATEWLRTGSTRRIIPGPSMVHSLFHLDSPSVTIVVRTPSAAICSPQLCYARSGLAHDDHVDSPRITKMRQMLTLLWGSGHPRRMVLSETALSSMDPLSAVRIILALHSQVPSEALASLLESLAARDPVLAQLMRDTLSCRRRDQLLVALRKQTKSPRHRMLLALVLNLPDRESIDSALRQIVPSESPEQWLWETIRSMHDTPALRSDLKNVLGFSLNDIGEQVLRMLLEGHSIDHVSKTVAEDDELVEDVRHLCSTLSASPVLSPLLGRQLAPA